MLLRKLGRAIARQWLLTGGLPVLRLRSGEGLRALDAARSRLAASEGRLLLRGMGDAVRIASELAGLAERFSIEESRV